MKEKNLKTVITLNQIATLANYALKCDIDDMATFMSIIQRIAEDELENWNES